MRGVKKVVGSGVRTRPSFPIYEYEPNNGEKIELDVLPDTYRSLVSAAILSLGDPDRGRIIVHGSAESGKTFFIIQMMRNIEAYQNKTNLKNFFPLCLTPEIFQEILRDFDSILEYLEYVALYMGIQTTELCVFVDNAIVAAKIVDSGSDVRIVFEASESMFDSISQADQVGMTSVWSGWDSFEIDEIVMPRSEFIDLVFLSQVRRVLDVYNFNLKRKHVLMLVEDLTRKYKIMTDENPENPKDPLIFLHAAHVAVITRRFAQICSEQGVDPNELPKENLRLIIDESEASFGSLIEYSYRSLRNSEGNFGGNTAAIAFELNDDGEIDIPDEFSGGDGIKSLFAALGVPTSGGTSEAAKIHTPLIFTPNKTLARRMTKSIIGQDEAIAHVADSMAIPTAKLNAPEKPLRTFLFLGPTGVGKTELSKVLAKELYKEEMNIIRLDMAEFNSPHSASALFGSTPGYVGYDENGGTLTREVMKHPNSLIILDEVEKAHVEIWDTMLQVFDAGRMTTGAGKVVDFSNTVIVMTSNLGSQEMSSHRLGFGGSRVTKTTIDIQKIALESLKKYFRPEFINRIDDIVVFKQLDAESARKIVLKEVLQVMAVLDAQGLELVKPKNDILDEILNISKFDEFGAREVQRVIQKKVSTPLAKAILNNRKNKKFKIVKDADNGMTVTIV